MLLRVVSLKREKKKFSVAPLTRLKEFCGENFREKKKNFSKLLYLSFSFSSFSSSSITIVSLSSQRPTAQKDFLLYIRSSIISSSSSIFLLLLQIEHASGQVSLDRPRVNTEQRRQRPRSLASSWTSSRCPLVKRVRCFCDEQS